MVSVRSLVRVVSLAGLVAIGCSSSTAATSTATPNVSMVDNKLSHSNNVGAVDSAGSTTHGTARQLQEEDDITAAPTPAPTVTGTGEEVFSGTMSPTTADRDLAETAAPTPAPTISEVSGASTTVVFSAVGSLAALAAAAVATAASVMA